MGDFSLVDELSIGRKVIVVKRFEGLVGKTELLAIAFEKGAGKRSSCSGFAKASVFEILIRKIQAMHLTISRIVGFDEGGCEGFQDASGMADMGLEFAGKVLAALADRLKSLGIEVHGSGDCRQVLEGGFQGPSNGTG